jgi:hypothetical protein
MQWSVQRYMAHNNQFKRSAATTGFVQSGKLRRTRLTVSFGGRDSNTGGANE